MEKEKKELVVSSTWIADGNLAMIVYVKPLDNKRELTNDLFWFSCSDEAPDFRSGQKYTSKEFIEKVNSSHMYKQLKFRSWDDIPNDVSMML